jgi:hypothetical protein
LSSGIESSEIRIRPVPGLLNFSKNKFFDIDGSSVCRKYIKSSDVEVLMKKMLLFMVTLLGGAIAGVVIGLIAGIFLPAEKRARLSQPFAARCGRMLERIPDE